VALGPAVMCVSEMLYAAGVLGAQG